MLASVTGLNRFRDINVYNSDRGIWLGGGFPGVSGSNRNQFQSIYISAGSRGNTGVQIDDGDTNTFISVDCETMVVGATPNATPTCYYIAQTGNSGLDNNANTFIKCVAESVVRTVDNNNQNTEFYGCVFPASTLLLTALPRIMIGDDKSSTPQILPGYKYQDNTYIAGVPNGYLYPNKIQSANGYSFPATPSVQTDPNTLDDYEEGIWTATDASGASLVLTSGGGMYVKIGQLVMAAVSVTYPVTADASAAIIGGLPFVCQANSGFNVFGGAITFTDSSLTMSCNVSNNASTVRLAKTDGNNVLNSDLSGRIVRYCVVYRSTN